MTMFCAQCGSPIEDGHRFCENCGANAPVNVEPAAPIPVASQAAPEQAPYAKVQPQPQAAASQAAYGQAQQQAPYSQPQQQAAYGAAGSYPPPSTPIFNAGAQKKASGTAVASLVLGIISVVTGLFFVGLVFGIIAIVLFVVARKNNDRSGVGIAGLVTGIVGTVMALFMILLLWVGVSLADEVSTTVDSSSSSSSSSDSFLPDVVTPDMVSGEWHLDSIYVPDEMEGGYGNCSLTYSQAKDLERAGEKATIKLDSSGTYVLRFDKVEVNGKWTLDDYFLELKPNGSENTIYAYYYDFDGDEDLMLVDSALVIDFVK